MNEVRQSVDSLDNWLEQNGWAGYDSYDIKNSFTSSKGVGDFKRYI